MVHHPDVITVVLADVFEAISESLTTSEQLFETGKTAAHRVAPRIDDLTVGQNQVDQSDMQEIIGQLVDKKWSIGSALDAGSLQVTLAQLQDLLPGQFGKDLRIFSRWIFALLVAQLARYRDDIHQLSGAFNL